MLNFVLKQSSDFEFTIAEGKEFHSHMDLRKKREPENVLANFGYSILAGLPRAKRAWDRAPYSWNMVNLFSFGCHVIDRAYVRTYVRTYVHTYVRVYRLYGWGRGDYQKEGRGVSGVSWQVHIFNIGF